MNYGEGGKPSRAAGQTYAVFKMDATGVKLLAIFVAQLTREGIVFEVAEAVDHYKVFLTGGF
jgi:hypothetical protein